MNEEEFKARFIATFCASWCANHYDVFCDTGQQDLLENPPMEDAINLADCAWNKWIYVNQP